MDELEISLNRLFFLDPHNVIPDDCPEYVIDFVGKTLGVKIVGTVNYPKLSRTLNTILAEDPKANIQNPESLQDIASFVNPDPDISWTSSKKLLEAGMNIINYIPKIPLKTDETFGYITEKTLNCIDPIMVYQIVCYYKIPHSRTSTLESLQKEISNYSSKLTPIRKGLLERLTSCIMSRNRRGLISLKTLIPSPNSDTPFDFPDKYPKTPEEAIERAAKEYRWDISLSSDPIAEYRELDSVSDDIYTPVDPKWREIFNINRKYFHLNFRFIPKFSHLYSSHAIQGLKYRNGGSLENDYLVLGIHPANISSFERVTAINHDPIPTDPIDQFRTLIGSPEFTISREELYNFWKFKGAFVSPCDLSKEFSHSQIDMIRVNSNPIDKIRLLIDFIRTQRDTKILKALESLSNNLDRSKEFLNKILNLGLTIRGYQICFDNYPLKESSYDLEKYQSEIEIQTTLQALEIQDNYSDLLSEIPMFTGRNILGSDTPGFKVFQYNLEYTLKDVIDRIFNPDEIEGCIRTNSNYLLITAWTFMKRIGLEEPYDISQLRMIA